VAIGGR